MTYMEQARKLRPIIEQATESLDDQTASDSVALFPHLKGDGSLIKSGKRINWNGVLKQATVDLWDTTENNPDNAPSLWTDIAYREGIRVIPETITAGLAFTKGERGWWGDALYASTMDANVWTPEQYPAGWEIITG